MIKGIDKILSFIEINNCTCYQLRQTPDKDSYLFQIDDSETPESRKNRFTDVLNMLAPGKYYLEAWQKVGQTRNWFRSYIYLEDSATFSIQNQPAMGGINMNGNVEKLISDAIEKERLYNKLSRLEEEKADYIEQIKELEENSSSNVIGRIFERVEPFIPSILSAFTGKTAAVGVAGIDRPIQINIPDIDRLKNVASRLEKIEPEYLQLLEKLCDKLEENPAMLSMIKNFI